MAIVLLALVASPAVHASTTVAVIMPGASKTEARPLTKRLRVAVDTVPEHEAVSATVTKKAVAKAKAEGIACEVSDEGCLGRLAVRVPASVLLVAALREGVLQVRTYDPVSGARLGEASEPLPEVSAEGDARLSAMMGLLLARDRVAGTLIVKTEAGARVTVDGLPPLLGPQARFDAVPAGTRHITITLQGRTAEREVEVLAGAVTELELMAPPPPPPPQAEPGGSIFNSLSIGGAVIGGLGLLVTLVGAGGALLADVMLVLPGGPVPPSLRAPLWFIEVALLIAATGGALGVLGGAATAGVGVALGVME